MLCSCPIDDSLAGGHSSLDQSGNRLVQSWFMKIFYKLVSLNRMFWFQSQLIRMCDKF